MFNCGIKALIAREVLRIHNPDVQMTGRQVLTTLNSKNDHFKQKKKLLQGFPEKFLHEVSFRQGDADQKSFPQKQNFEVIVPGLFRPVRQRHLPTSGLLVRRDSGQRPILLGRRKRHWDRDVGSGHVGVVTLVLKKTGTS
jgi:hypothetical protein